MDIDQRDEEIWRMRKEGTPFSKIATHFDISTSRAQQIYRRRQDKIDNLEKWPPLKKLLPIRIQKILIRVFGSEEIYKNPEKLVSMGPEVFMTWQNFGRKSAMQLTEALESLGHSVSQNITMTDPACQIFLKIGKAILQNYFEYYTKNSMDDAEYIPTVRVIIEGTTKEMKSSGMGEPNCNELTEKLKTFNRQMYQNIWIEHAKEDEDGKEEPVDLGKECELAGYTFDYIYKHREHPP